MNISTNIKNRVAIHQSKSSWIAIHHKRRKTTTDTNFYDTLDIEECLMEEDEMQTKYHNENSIYLYCTLDRQTAESIIHTNNYPTPLVLYETPNISRAMAVKHTRLSNFKDSSKSVY